MLPKSFLYDNIEISDPDGIANTFNEYFVIGAATEACRKNTTIIYGIRNQFKKNSL